MNKMKIEKEEEEIDYLEDLFDGVDLSEEELKELEFLGFSAGDEEDEGFFEEQEDS